MREETGGTGAEGAMKSRYKCQHLEYQACEEGAREERIKESRRDEPGWDCWDCSGVRGSRRCD